MKNIKHKKKPAVLKALDVLNLNKEKIFYESVEIECKKKIIINSNVI